MHVALIMDGNRRYGAEHGVDGHQAGLDALMPLLVVLVEKKVDVTTLFVWSTHNWKRTPVELQSHRQLIRRSLAPLLEVAREHDIVYRIVSTDTSHFTSEDLETFRELETQTKEHQGMRCNVCCSYSSQQEMEQAAQQGPIEQHLLIPEPVDLLIRTAEQRLSDFLLWQCAFAEIFFFEEIVSGMDPGGLGGHLDTIRSKRETVWALNIFINIHVSLPSLAGLDAEPLRHHQHVLGTVERRHDTLYKVRILERQVCGFVCHGCCWSHARIGSNEFATSLSVA